MNTRIHFEQLAITLYQSHAAKHRQKLTPAERTQQPLPPAWHEIGTELRNVWRNNALQLITEQSQSIAHQDLPS